ncbi:MAG TPA: TonB-dependent receptor [Rhizomicrobium sp.]|jgi:iron complex outermembrane receptor protein
MHARRFQFSGLMLGVSAFALAAAGLFAAAPAMAQPASATDVESVVVTGTSIHGIAPVGSNLVTVGTQDIEKTAANTMQDVLATVPQLGTFNQAPTPTANSDGIVSTAPNLRNIGQAQTLDLINGHRFVGAGHLQTISDPSIVPTVMVQRVEILPDGASAVYGSDAISGVVNVITRSDYDGLQLKIGGSAGDSYLAGTASALFGMTWTGGGFAAGVEYTGNGRLSGQDRDFVTSNFTATGGFDNRSLSCAQPTVNANGTNYGYPGLQAGTQNRCDLVKDQDLYPQQSRIGALVNWHQDITESIRLHGDLFASRQDTNSHVTALSISGLTIPNTNPYFALPAGVAATTESVTMDSESVLGGPYATDRNYLTTFGGTIGVDADLFGKFVWSTYVAGSASVTGLYEQQLNSDALVAAGAATTTATAFDPFQGRTSQAVRDQIANYENFFGSHQHLVELNSKIDGPLFDLPGGTVRAAVGGVYREETYDGIQTSGQRFLFQNPGTASGVRHVGSVFGELYVPVIGDANQLPFIKGLDLSVEGRYDHYSDVGGTTNPKYGFNWKPVDDLTIHGSYGTSFHAPALADLHGPDTRTGFYFGTDNPPGFTNLTLAHIWLAGGNGNLQPEKSLTRSLGFDWQPKIIPGLHMGATWYSVYFTGLVGFPDGSQFYTNPAYQRFWYFNNGNNLDPTLVASIINGLRRQSYLVPANVVPAAQYIGDFRRYNLAAIKTQGIDFDAVYAWEDPWGSWSATIDGEQGLKYANSPIEGAPFVNSYLTGQVPLNLRATLNWEQGPYVASLKLNYSSSYKDIYTTTAGSPDYENVRSFTTVSVYGSYDLGELGVWENALKDTNIALNIDNLFDTAPPYSMSTGRYSGWGVGYGSPLGRVFSASLTKKF